MWPPFGGDEAAAIEEDQPRGRGKEGKHKQTRSARDQEGDGGEGNWEFEQERVVHDPEAEREDEEEEKVLEVKEGVVVLLERSESRGQGGYDRPVYPAEPSRDGWGTWHRHVYVSVLCRCGYMWAVEAGYPLGCRVKTIKGR